MTETQHRSAGRIAITTAAEALLVAAAVFGVGWGLARLADKRHALPVQADKDGVIRLTVRESDWQGNTEFHDVSKFSGYWHCEGDWQLKWLFTAPTAGDYAVTLEATCPIPTATGAVELSVGGQTFRCPIDGTAEPLKWRTAHAARLRLDGEPRTLTLRPASPAPVNIKTVIIRPAVATTAPATAQRLRRDRLALAARTFAEDASPGPLSAPWRRNEPLAKTRSAGRNPLLAFLARDVRLFLSTLAPVVPLGPLALFFLTAAIAPPAASTRPSRTRPARSSRRASARCRRSPR